MYFHSLCNHSPASMPKFSSLICSPSLQFPVFQCQKDLWTPKASSPNLSEPPAIYPMLYIMKYDLSIVQAILHIGGKSILPNFLFLLYAPFRPSGAAHRPFQHRITFPIWTSTSYMPWSCNHSSLHSLKFSHQLVSYCFDPSFFILKNFIDMQSFACSAISATLMHSK